MTENLLTLEGLHTHLRSARGLVRAVDGIDLNLRPGETLGLVGESGCGKTMTARAIMGMVTALPGVVAGAIRFGSIGDLLSGLADLHRADAGPPTARQVRRWRQQAESLLAPLRGRRLSLIPQDPQTSLNPYWTLGEHLAEMIRLRQGRAANIEAVRIKALEWLDRVHLRPAEKFVARHPHELSGGQCQRAMIAIALAAEPEFVVADEPTTGLDVTVQAELVDLFAEIKQERGLTMLLISHDLGLISLLADRVAVMYCGQIVEVASRERIFPTAAPDPTWRCHPYTAALLAAMYALQSGADASALQAAGQALPGEVPDLAQPPAGCPFHPRCRALDPQTELAGRCRTQRPAVLPRQDGNLACWLGGTRLPVPIRGDAPTRVGGRPEPLLTVDDLRAWYRPAQAHGWGLLADRQPRHQVLHGVSLTVRRGETLGLVGESGAGKTTLGKAILRLLDDVTGKICYDGLDVLSLNPGALRALRRRVQMIFQNPYAALNRHMRVCDILAEAAQVGGVTGKAAVTARVADLAAQVRLHPGKLTERPAALSGGERRRVGIARILAVGPELIVADEPLAALDLTIKAQIIDLLLELQQGQQLSMLVISHDIAAVWRLSHRIAVMYLGQLVEVAPRTALSRSGSQHPYTRRLLAAAAFMGDYRVQGALPEPGPGADLGKPRASVVTACPYCARCDQYTRQGRPEICRCVPPPLSAVAGRPDTEHWVACHFPVPAGPTAGFGAL
jgi:peptide/nickel transport system ATP-binding protein